MKTTVKNAALGAFVGAAVTLCIAAATNEISPTIWEHKIVPPPPSQANTAGLVWAVDSAGRDGWEAVAVGANAGDPWVLMRRAKK